MHYSRGKKILQGWVSSPGSRLQCWLTAPWCSGLILSWGLTLWTAITIILPKWTMTVLSTSTVYKTQSFSLANCLLSYLQNRVVIIVFIQHIAQIFATTKKKKRKRKKAKKHQTSSGFRQTHTHTHTQTNAHTHMHACTHMRTHTQTHTHTHKESKMPVISILRSKCWKWIPLKRKSVQNGRTWWHKEKMTFKWVPFNFNYYQNIQWFPLEEVAFPKQCFVQKRRDKKKKWRILS